MKRVIKMSATSYRKWVLSLQYGCLLGCMQDQTRCRVSALWPCACFLCRPIPVLTSTIQPSVIPSTWPCSRCFETLCTTWEVRMLVGVNAGLLLEPYSLVLALCWCQLRNHIWKPDVVSGVVLAAQKDGLSPRVWDLSGHYNKIPLSPKIKDHMWTTWSHDWTL